MTVKPLIAALSEEDPDAEIYVLVDDEGVLWPVDEVTAGTVSIVPDEYEGGLVSDASAPGFERLPGRHGVPNEPRTLERAVILDRVDE